MIIQLFIAPKH